MHEKFLKPYNPKETEGKTYKRWEESGFFNPDNLPGEREETFSIVLPPPNVTGTLHMGSALMLAIEDTAVRFQRMRGKSTLWIPGTDSAAIATQAKVEKDIQKKEGKNRQDLGREELLKRINTFVEENKTTILNQIRAMGASVDWSRYAYTMDEKRYGAVMTAFVRMYEAGLIYRGNRIVNWDPKGQTTISDDEIVYEERKAKLYTFKYSADFPISISTTRPETKVGDTAVAVHPGDSRYQKYIGKEYSATFCDVPITIKIIADESVDKEFGTGALGVTPAHSHTDWDIADRHNLDRPQVINEFAKMTVPGRLNGKKTTEARDIVVEWLTEEKLLEKEEEIPQNIGTAERTGGIIEPLPKLQWFIDVDKPFVLPHSNIPSIASGDTITLKEMMRKAVEGGGVKILTERFEKTYFHWIDNLRPWCISRQIWFGHRIPAWYHDTCGAGGFETAKYQTEAIISITPPTECPFCKATLFVDGNNINCSQDPDVLDTWFSSALWTFSTLGWPDNTPDLKRFHPTTVIESGYDILFFWIARMILMSGFFLGEVPFKTAYLHGLVRDTEGRKISKSLGNNIDPVDMGEKYGTDAVRLSLIIGVAPGADSKISEDKIRGYKNFANKIWNAARFVLTASEGVDLSKKPPLTEKDAENLKMLNETLKDVTSDLDNFRFHLAAEKLYHYFWHTFADVIIEESKPRLNSTDSKDKTACTYVLYQILKNSLITLHPFMPFITEEVWSSLPDNKDNNLLMIARWPA